jgi:hypothetical protein
VARPKGITAEGAATTIRLTDANAQFLEAIQKSQNGRALYLIVTDMLDAVRTYHGLPRADQELLERDARSRKLSRLEHLQHIVVEYRNRLMRAK